MAELRPAPFADHVTRLYLEPRRQNALFELPRDKWYLPAPDSPDLSVAFHDKRAGNSSGPAAGPHTQMAQNLLLSYVAGGRILELKTVQVNDRLTIGRPCIDITNIGYNIEWSQELLVDESLREYVAGAMLIEMFRHSREHTHGLLDGPAGDVIYDISVGYDLAGIRSDKICAFLNGMRNAGDIVEQLRAEIPDQFAHARGLDFPTSLSNSITLSTFHGCPADEIERICEFLIGDMGFDVIVKMNPPTLGKEKLEHLLFDVLGYTELVVNPTAYASVVSFADSIDLAHRLISFAAARNRRVGYKFSNTLEVMNHRDFFTKDNKIMYLSGQPLHVITMTLTDEFRRALAGDRLKNSDSQLPPSTCVDIPISFSAGVDQHNFAMLAACGFVPITSSTDLLRPGGYARLGKYLAALTREMQSLGTKSIDDFILRWPTSRERQRAVTANLDQYRDRKGAALDVDTMAISSTRTDTFRAALDNTTIVAEIARNDPRYRADKNRTIPKRIDSHLTTFDCITCDKCLPVCPNAANFTYPTPKVAFDFHDLIITPDGRWSWAAQSRRFAIEQTMQIACYADFCNECGNCDTFCPEYGGPYIKKPTFFGSLESWQRAAPRDGFIVGNGHGNRWIRGRVQGKRYTLKVNESGGTNEFSDEVVLATFADDSAQPHEVTPACELQESHTLDMWLFHTMQHLLAGVLDSSRINQVNARWM